MLPRSLASLRLLALAIVGCPCACSTVSPPIPESNTPIAIGCGLEGCPAGVHSIHQPFMALIAASAPAPSDGSRLAIIAWA